MSCPWLELEELLSKACEPKSAHEEEEEEGEGEGGEGEEAKAKKEAATADGE